MSIQKTLTVTLTTHGDVDGPCVAACPEMGLATDGPTVPAALHALAKALEIYDNLAGGPRASEAPAAPAPSPTPAAAPADEPRLQAVPPRGRRPKTHELTRHGTPPPALRSA